MPSDTDKQVTGAMAYVTVEIECSVGVWQNAETCAQLHKTALREGVDCVESMVREHNRRNSHQMRVIKATGTQVVTRVEK